MTDRERLGRYQSWIYLAKNNPENVRIVNPGDGWVWGPNLQVKTSLGEWVTIEKLPDWDFESNRNGREL